MKLYLWLANDISKDIGIALQNFLNKFAISPTN
jgi:hypothetical protein